jgi:putative ABC transport system permease protein
MIATFDLPTLVIRQDGRVRSDTVARAAFVRARLREIREVTGVRAAGAASAAPFSGVMPDAPLTSERGGGGVYSVSSGYFRAAGIALIAGRDLTDEESFSAAPVGVLNESAARQLCGAVSSCLGQFVHAPSQPARTVVGVVRDARPSLTRAPMPAMYVPFDVSRFAFGSIVIDAVDSPENRERLKQALAASPDSRVEVRSLDEARDRELSPFRFNAVIVGAFGVLTLALALMGVYGVMSAVVGERTREYGIRLALGATRQRVNQHVLRQAAMPIAAGLAGGLLLAVWGSRYIASLLFGIVPLDATSFLAAGAIVTITGIAAALIPARRAGRVDPILALRAE